MLYEVITEDVVEKPSIEEAPSCLASFGRMILNQEIINILKKTPLGKGNELWMVDAIRTYVKNRITSYNVCYTKLLRDKAGSYLMADIAHIAGLVVAGLHPHPFPHADVVTTTTHKTLRGPRSGLILCKKNDRFDLEGRADLATKIDRAVFPGLQGGPLDHVIAAKAIIFKEAMRADFRKYQQRILKNTQAMVNEFKSYNFV